MNVADLTLHFYNEAGSLVMVLIWDRRWTTFNQGRDWAEEVLRLTPKKQFDRFGTYLDAATIEEGDKVLWTCHQSSSPVQVIACDYRSRLEAYRRSREAAPGEVLLHVRL